MNLLVKLQSQRLQAFLSRKFKVLSALLGILCFVILPGLIIIAGLDSMTAQYSQEQLINAQEQLEKALDDLEYFSRNDRFAHFLLYPFCHNQNGEKKYAAELPKRILALKEKFPGVFTILVSDLNGKLIPELSDEGGFSYLYKQAFLLISELETCLKKNARTEVIENLELRLNRIKSLIGNIINPKDLLLPLKNIEGGRSILADGSKQKFHIWYNSGKDFRIIVYISRKFIKSEHGLKWATSRINDINDDITVGFSAFPPDEKNIQPRLREHLNAKIIKKVALHESGLSNSYNSIAELSGCRFFNHTTSGFSIFRKTNAPYADTTKNQHLAFILKAALVTLFILTVYQLRNPISLTVKLKVTAFFCYAVLLPVLTIASLTSMYVHQEESRLNTELQKKAHLVLEKIDSGYDNFSGDLTISINEAFTEIVEGNPAFIPDKAHLEKLFQEFSRIIMPGEAFFIDIDGKDLMQTIAKPKFYNSTLLRRICGQTLQMVSKNDFSRAAPAPEKVSRAFVATMRQNHQKLRYLGISDLELAACFKIGSPGDSKRLFFAAAFWRLHELHNFYVERFYKKFISEHKSLKFAAFCNDQKKITVESDQNNHGLLRFIQLANNKYSFPINHMRLAGKNYTGIVIPGRKLKTMTMACLFPKDIVNRQIDRIRTKSQALTAFLCLIGIATLFLLKNWIFRPIEELRRGLRAIAARNFNFRLEKVCDNELGKLMDAFNHSLETLQELEVARIVQESILSQNQMQHLNGHIVAKSLSMTNLGGDYFDMIKLDEQRIMAFIGDATGHGIPAALSMAMAKAVLSHEKNLGLCCKNVMLQLNNLFRTLRQQGAKDFMTAMCLDFNCDSGEILIINAGQCYPILLQKGNDTAEILSHIRGIPPGFKDNYSPEAHKVRLTDEDRLFIFTDGFVECCDAGGQAIGFDGLARLIAKNWHSDTHTHMENIFAALKKLSDVQQDDCTMLLLRFDQNG